MDVDNEGMPGEENIERNSGDVYGENVDLDFQIVDNPYYGGEVEIDQNGECVSMNDLNLNNTHIITSTQNDYYEM